MRYYKGLFNSTDTHNQFRNYHPLNPNYELLFKKKNHISLVPSMKMFF